MFTHTNYYEAIPGLSDNAAFLIGLVLRMPAVLRTLPTEVAESCSPSELSSPEISAQVFSLPYRSRRTFAITASFASSGTLGRAAAAEGIFKMAISNRNGSSVRIKPSGNCSRVYFIDCALWEPGDISHLRGGLPTEGSLEGDHESTGRNVCIVCHR